jgi:predicted nucleic acid-binding Zn ribbon protein
VVPAMDCAYTYACGAASRDGKVCAANGAVIIKKNRAAIKNDRILWFVFLFFIYQ